jgi:hypothetical protein
VTSIVVVSVRMVGRVDQLGVTVVVKITVSVR